MLVSDTHKYLKQAAGPVTTQALSPRRPWTTTYGAAIAAESSALARGKATAELRRLIAQPSLDSPGRESMFPVRTRSWR